jgi:hypothetical protein
LVPRSLANEGTALPRRRRFVVFVIQGHNPRDDWEEVHEYDAHYFYNRVTRETAWELPKFDDDVPAKGKKQKKDKKGKGASAAAAAAAAAVSDDGDDGGGGGGGGGGSEKKSKKSKKAAARQQQQQAEASPPTSPSSAASSPARASPSKRHNYNDDDDDDDDDDSNNNHNHHHDNSDAEVRYTVNPQDDAQGVTETSNFVYRIDPADHWDELEEFGAKYYQNRITSE